MSAPTKVQLVGGHFQDAEGNVLALGHLVMELVQDEQLSSSIGQVCGGIKLLINLDSAGSVSTAPAQSVWSPENMAPAGASYTVWGYTAQGELAWGPNYNLDVPIGATFDVDNWLPNSTGSNGGGNTGGITLQTNGVNNASQSLLNLESTDSSVVITDLGAGNVNFKVGGGTSGPRPGIANWHYYGADDGGGTGTFATSAQAAMSMGQDINGAITSQAPTATEPMYKLATGSAGAGAHYAGASNFTGNHGAITLGLLTEAEQRVQTPSSANVRYWICTLTSYVGGGPMHDGFLEADQPNVAIAGNSCIGFRYSTAAGDTHWQCYAGDLTGGAPTIVDSGVAIDTTAGHIFELRQTVAGTVLYLIDGVQVASISTTLPPLDTPHSLCMHVDNAGVTGAKAVAGAYWYWEASK